MLLDNSSKFLPPDPFGAVAPWAVLPAPDNPNFHLHVIAGRYILILFAGDTTSEACRAAVRHMITLFPLLEKDRDAGVIISTRPLPKSDLLKSQALVQLVDAQGVVHGAFRASQKEGQPLWVLLDPSLRVLAQFREPVPAALADHLAALPPAAEHAGCAIPPPVLIAPRIFEPEFCRQLVEFYEANGGSPSGFMRQMDGRTRLIHDAGHKLRQDCLIPQENPLREEILHRFRMRLLPMIARAFQFEATRMERYLVARYDTDYGGHFRPHRDNTTSGTAHRRFAVSVGLTTDYEGGEVRFPEYSPRSFKAPLGGAVVFSCSILHEVTPMRSGVRYIFLPFLYDDAGSEVRKANAGLVDDEPEYPES